MTHTSAHDLINKVLDPDSFISWDTPPDYGSISPSYEADLARAREKSGVDEAVITGEGTVGGVRVAFVLSEFFAGPGEICLSPPLRAGHACRKAAQHSP